MSAMSEARFERMMVNIKGVVGKCLSSTRFGMDVDTFGLGQVLLEETKTEKEKELNDL